jgi:hypothetical protein
MRVFNTVFLRSRREPGRRRICARLGRFLTSFRMNIEQYLTNSIYSNTLVQNRFLTFKSHPLCPLPKGRGGKGREASPPLKLTVRGRISRGAKPLSNISPSPIRRGGQGVRSVVYYYGRHWGNLVFHAVKSCLKYERIYQEKTLFKLIWTAMI